MLDPYIQINVSVNCSFTYVCILIYIFFISHT